MATHAHTPTNPLPSILTLGMALAETEHAYRRLDKRTCGRKNTVHEDNVFQLLYDREWGLRSLISMAPATSLADAAVQIGTASAFVATLDCCDWTDPAIHKRLDDLHTALHRITLSVLPVVAAAAGLDLAAMVWDHADELRANLFFAGEQAA